MKIIRRICIGALAGLVSAGVLLLAGEAGGATEGGELKKGERLEIQCLACHREQKLPDNLIYRRYLLKYSSARRIERALITYLQSPSRAQSIMPREFFLRFPFKAPSPLSESALRAAVRAYMERFDVKRRLRLEPHPGERARPEEDGCCAPTDPDPATVRPAGQSAVPLRRNQP